jgi:hypothetical protein
MKVVGKDTEFTSKVNYFIKTGKNENEGKYKPTREQIESSVEDFFTNQSELVNEINLSISNGRRSN